MNRMRRKVAAIIFGVLLGAGVLAPTTALASTPPEAWAPECPATIHCVVDPAAYEANDGNIEDYGNYDFADRPNDGLTIDTILVHNTEGDLPRVRELFKNPRSYVSSHYVLDGKSCTVYQMVPLKNIAWHAGWRQNMHSVGFEHVGYAATGVEYTPCLYKMSAELSKYLIKRFNMPCNNLNCVIGHDNVSPAKAGEVAKMHNDPGPYWNWELYRKLIGSVPVDITPLAKTSNFNLGVTIAPAWERNKQVVTGCSNGSNPPSCAPAGPQKANFVYVRSEPRVDAPLFTDPVLGQGTTDINNNAARLFYGQTFAVAEHKFDSGGVWLKLWINGASGWLYSPWATPTVLPAIGGKYAKPRAGLGSVPVYGKPSPQASDYPEGLLDSPPASFWIPTLAPTAPLPRTIAAGQKYKIIDANTPNDHFYAWSSTADRSRFPYDHTVFKGKEQYISVWLGNRVGYLRAADIDIV